MNDQVTHRAVPSEAAGATRQRRVEGGRQHVVKVKLADAEYDAIAGLAADLKVSIQRLLVSSALIPKCRTGTQAPAARIPAPAVAELAGLRRLTANLANNINQIARVLNSGGTPGGSIPATADAVRRVMVRLDSVLAGLGADSSGRPADRSIRAPAVPSGHGSSRPAVPPARIVPEAPS